MPNLSTPIIRARASVHQVRCFRQRRQGCRRASKKCLPAATLPPYLPPAPAAAVPAARLPHTPRQHRQTGAGSRTSSPPAAANNEEATLADGFRGRTPMTSKRRKHQLLEPVKACTNADSGASEPSHILFYRFGHA